MQRGVTVKSFCAKLIIARLTRTEKCYFFIFFNSTVKGYFSARENFFLIEICERTKIGDSTELPAKAVLHLKHKLLQKNERKEGRKEQCLKEILRAKGGWRSFACKSQVFHHCGPAFEVPFCRAGTTCRKRITAANPHMEIRGASVLNGI